jgi:hypothetical protein
LVFGGVDAVAVSPGKDNFPAQFDQQATDVFALKRVPTYAPAAFASGRLKQTTPSLVATKSSMDGTLER